MVLCVLVVGKMVRSCFGIWLKGRRFALLRLARLFTLYDIVPNPNRYWLCADEIQVEREDDVAISTKIY
ncbi:hypothetical protein F2Q70_00035879 [Brassica cretica]|uniref:Uncharacterized protein n=1 Tax=Brassica cretica TaxID=69181 RepID=A0A8S9JVC8_BRACR|nr:hypothetical protein F2Q70_00035879 [Brassica cretica]